MIASALPLLLKATLITIQASLLGTIFGLSIGTVLGVMNSQRFRLPYVWRFISAYVGIIRGTPMFIQLLIVYFALPELIGIDIPPLSAGVITLTLNSSAYLSEIIRGGLNAIPIGQWEAADSLGYSRCQSLIYIILPQALKISLPAITNEFSTLIKESSILMVIGVPELVKASRDIVARELRPMEIYGMTALIYLVLTTAVALGTKQLEKKL